MISKSFYSTSSFPNTELRLKQFRNPLFLILVSLMAFLPLLVSCTDASSEATNASSETTTYAVTFNSGEGSSVPAQNVASGEKAARPADDPQRSGYLFENWYADNQFQTVYDFNQPVTGDITLYAAWDHELRAVIESGAVPSDLSTYGSLVQAVLEPYTAGATIEAMYVDAAPRGTGDADSWENAAGDIKAIVDGAGTDASTVYLVLAASGEHTPAASLAMKKNVAIVGGWNKWEQTGTSTISGEDTRLVFNNANIDRTALLYGVTIANGKGSYGGGMHNSNASPALSNVTFSGNIATTGGGGMHNSNASPTLSNVTFSGNTAPAGGGMYNIGNASPALSNVTFSGNTAKGKGGGMYNSSASPALSNVTFSGNTATVDGGGMYNDSASPTLSNVTFSGNTALSGGGGMYNSNALPALSNVTFSGNTATVGGGGMCNSNASPTLSNVTFSGNTTTGNGGGMYNDNNGGVGPTIVNTLFWNNTGGASNETVGQQIYMRNNGSWDENITISFSLVQHGITTTNATSDDDDGLGIAGSSASVTITQANNISGDPMLDAANNLADNGGAVQTIALLDNSAAIDAGVYVQRSGTVGSFTFYYSENDTEWFSDTVLNTAITGTIPTDAIELTATDARGYIRSARPDIGAYEYGGTAP